MSSSSPLSKKIRALLREADEPMTVNELAARLDVLRTSVSRTLNHNMPDAYIKDWRESYRVRASALWTVVVPPPNAPEPPAKRSSIVRNRARDTKPKEKPKAVKPPKKEKPPKFVPQGLTFWQPVKPWGTLQ